MEPILFELESILGVDDLPPYANTNIRCDLCSEEVGEGRHDCPGDVFAQPYSEFLDEE